MRQTRAHTTLVVRDYDEAIAYFTEKLRFDLIEDTLFKDRGGRDKRGVLVAPPRSRGTQILLAERGVKFVREPKEEEYGTVAVFERSLWRQVVLVTSKA